MLKFVFWSLLAINALLFAYGRGMLGSAPGERDSAKITNQLNTDKLLLLAGAGGDALKPKAATAPAPLPAPAPGDLAACTEIGNFSAAEARHFDKLIAPLALDDTQLSQADVQSQEITSHMVMIPPLGSKEAAEQKAALLKEQGVSNYFIMNDSAPTKWAISLGVFKSETAAKTLLAALVKQGVTGAKIVGRSSSATRTAYRFRNIDPAARARLDTIAARFDTVETGKCK